MVGWVICLVAVGLGSVAYFGWLALTVRRTPITPDPPFDQDGPEADWDYLADLEARRQS